MRFRFFLDMLPYEPKETKYIWGPETDAVSKGSWGWSDTLFIVAGFVILCALAALTVHDILMYKRKVLYPSGKPGVSQKRLWIVIAIDIVFVVAAVLYFILKQ